MRIVFIGCVISSEYFLNALIRNNSTIVGVITKKESAYNADFRDLSAICKKNEITYYYTQNVNDIETTQFIQSKQPDIIYCFGWSQLIKKEIIDIPKHGILGFHPTKLPDNKGRHPIIWALALGLKSTASTFFMINESADAGEIVSQKEIEILYEDDASTLYAKILEIAAQQIISYTNDLQNNSAETVHIKNSEGNIWRKRSEEDGKIDFRMSSYAVYNLIRALTHPYIGAHFIFQNRKYTVWKAKEVHLTNADHIEPGKVLEVMSDTNFIVKTFDHAIELIHCDNITIKKGDYLI